MTFHLGRSRGLLRNVIPALRVLARWDAPNATTTLASSAAAKRVEISSAARERDLTTSASSSTSSPHADMSTSTAPRGPHRLESDIIGSMLIPRDALYGIATARAMENYDITGVKLSAYPDFIRAFAFVKKACARANFEIGLLPRNVHDAIASSCDELLKDDALHEHFTVDVIQGGAGTSTNMNANEVIANLAQRRMGLPLGDYSAVCPNDHVNLCQSTNDAYPSAAKLAVVFRHTSVVHALRELITSLRAKGDQFGGVIKMGRTQLQDAVPMTLGQEFHSFASTLEADLAFMQRNVDQLYEMNLGGTAIGTSICADARFSHEAVKALSELTRLPLQSPKDFIEASSSTSSFLLFSNILRRVAVKVSKICNDLRLLSSGPRCGFNEINLPAVAPGSSIMPGKINPVIPEVANQVCFQIMGADQTIATASEAAQLQLNVFEPVIVYNLLNNLKIMTNALNTLRTKCVDGITANEDACKKSVDNSIGIVTALLPLIGYKKASAVAKEALETGAPVATIAAKYAPAEKVKEYLKVEAMTCAGTIEARGVCLDTPPPPAEEVA
tara:strand:+ start:422 stop:2098 length:1677 start_codon:yes stop_codon:yes gene_type:complete|eukprot:30980-Pelagococcus_subviridis.AAC.49